MSYLGKSPTGTGIRSRYYYTATGGETSISGADDSGAILTFTDGAYVDVYLNGVLLVAGTDYNTSTANTISSLAALAGSDIVEVLVYDIFTVADTVKASSGGTFNGGVTINGDLTVDTNTLYVDNTNNRVGIGTSSPTASKLQVDGTDGTIARFRTTSGANNTVINITSSDAAGTAGFSVGGNASFPAMTFENGGSEAMRIDSSGNVGIGTSSPNSKLHISGNANNSSALSDTVTDFALKFDSATTTNYFSNAICFAEGTNVNASIASFDGGSGGAQGLVFGTGASNTERMRIDSNGEFMINKTAALFNNTGLDFRVPENELRVTRDGAAPFSLNRINSDGTLVQFAQDGTVEGTISVSGSTVSYNGGHLSRWSRLVDDSKDTSIVKGTVMTNLDAMVEWGDEDNEQLNKMAVSSVEGDANVSGVFVNWDNDDDFNDMNIAMTGDMVIRIAQGTTVARGDLLMSAGDGTAKPQGDDIVRSKTIAKVTSTHVSHTYDDGSYLVPCVLMAC